MGGSSTDGDNAPGTPPPTEPELTAGASSAAETSGVAAPANVPLIDTLFKRVLFAAISLFVLLAAVFLWSWWLPMRIHEGWTAIGVFFTLCFWNETLDAIVSTFLLHRAKLVNHKAKAPCMRVAMIATKVPSEPLELVKKTLTAMLNQDYRYSHDVWLCDEKPDAETRAWCAEAGVRISTREGVADYHRPVWPRRTKCKEGNVAYFYDNYGYDMYDVVAQFDADHVPEPSYLSTVLPAFTDPKIGYVACPSICGANAEVSWAVRGRLYDESYMHGPWGASVAVEFLPSCIGSHYVVRTAYLKSAGGIGPELDEDMSTSYIMTANGYKGAFGHNTIANGDGPANFEDCMRQEYQWARSAMMIATRYMFPWFGPGYKLTVVERLRVLHWMSVWVVRPMYVIFGPIALLGLAAGWFKVTASLQPWQGIIHTAPLALASLLQWTAARQLGWLRPTNPPLISWECILYKATRNYYSTMGSIHGLIGGILGLHLDIKVTPKGDAGERLIANRNIAPVLLMAAVGLLGTAMTPQAEPLWRLLLAMMGYSNLFCAIAIVALHYKENHRLKSLQVGNLMSLSAPLLLLTALGAYIIADLRLA